MEHLEIRPDNASHNSNPVNLDLDAGVEFQLASAVKSTIQWSKSFSTRKGSIEPTYLQVLTMDQEMPNPHEVSLESFADERLIDPPVPEVFLPSMTSVQRLIKKKREHDCSWDDLEIEIPFIPMFNRTIVWEDEISIYSVEVPLTDEGSQLSLPSDSLDGERRSLAKAILGTEEGKEMLVLD